MLKLFNNNKLIFPLFEPFQLSDVYSTSKSHAKTKINKVKVQVESHYGVNISRDDNSNMRLNQAYKTKENEKCEL